MTDPWDWYFYLHLVGFYGKFMDKHILGQHFNWMVLSNRDN